MHAQRMHSKHVQVILEGETDGKEERSLPTYDRLSRDR
jgi:hypothetical protein